MSPARRVSVRSAMATLAGIAAETAYVLALGAIGVAICAIVRLVAG
jgi:hypothetical protein